MDDARRRDFDCFLALHASKATTTDEPMVHAMFHNHSSPLLGMDEEDLKGVLDVEEELPTRLLQQLRTYDCRTQRILALIFDRKTVLSTVLWDAEFAASMREA